MCGNNIVMTKETFFHGWNPGIWGPFHEGMTEATVDLFHPRMDPVAEINWLLRPNISLGKGIYKIEHDSQKNGHNPQPDISPLRFDCDVF